MSTDLTFITNEEGKKLKDRFETLIRDSKYFDCLVGYFFISGFHQIYRTLENTEKIRILIGIGNEKTTYELLTSYNNENQQTLPFSHAEAKQIIEGYVENELEESQDNSNVESGVIKFIEWLKTKNLKYGLILHRIFMRNYIL